VLVGKVPTVARLAQWLAGLFIGALVSRAVDLLTFPLPDGPFIVGAAAVTVGCIVAWTSARLLVFARAGSAIGSAVVTLLSVSVVVAMSLLVGAVITWVVERAACGAWPNLGAVLLRRDVLAFFVLPSLGLALPLAAIYMPTRRSDPGYDYEDRPEPSVSERLRSAVGALALLGAVVVRVALFALGVGAVGLYWLHVEDFAGRWPAVFECPI
jgi:hypothetical protein